MRNTRSLNEETIENIAKAKKLLDRQMNKFFYILYLQVFIIFGTNNQKYYNQMNHLHFIYIILRHSAKNMDFLKRGRNCIERVVRKSSKMCM